VIAGTIFIVVQLRQNAKLTSPTIQANKSAIGFTLIEGIIDDSFVRRRKNVYDAVKKYGGMNWEGFEGTFEDFEARNYAYMFELFGQLVKEGIIDQKTVMDALKYVVVIDCRLMEPLLNHLNEQYKLKLNPWWNFEWLDKETDRYLKLLESQAGPQRK
jgi:hypothetical protein